MSTAIRNRLLLGLLSLAGVVLVLFFTSRYGIGVSPDSAAYMSTAKNLLAGNGYVQYDGDVFLYWPPLFPTLLAFVGLSGFDIVDIARYVNAVSFGLIIFVSGLWFLENVKSTFLTLLGSTAILLSIPLVAVSVFAWTETLFALFVQLFLFAMGNFLKDGKTTVFFLSALFAAFACLSRYVGIMVVLTGVVLLLLKQKISLVHRVNTVIAFVLVSVLPLGIWLVRNYVVSSTLTGVRGPSAYTLWQNLYFILDSVSTWFLPVGIPSMARHLSVVFVLLLVFGVGVSTAIRRGRACSVTYLPVMLIGCFLVLYTVGLAISATQVTTHQINLNYRYSSPIYAPLVLLIVLVVDQYNSDRRLSKRIVSFCLIALIGVWLVYQLASTVEMGVRFIKDGVGGYSTSVWVNSDLMDYLKTHQLPGKIYSNVPHGVYVITGVSAKLSPCRELPFTAQGLPTNDLARLAETLRISEDDVYLVWFDNRQARHFYTVPELRIFFDLEPVVMLSDGSIYRITGVVSLPPEGDSTAPSSN